MDRDRDRDIDIDIDIMCMWQPVGMFSVGQHHSRNKWPGLFPLPDSQQPGLLASILRALSLSSLPQNTQRPLGRSQHVKPPESIWSLPFWDHQMLDFGTSKIWNLQISQRNLIIMISPIKMANFWGVPSRNSTASSWLKMLKKMLYNVQGKNVPAYIPHF